MNSTAIDLKDLENRVPATDLREFSKPEEAFELLQEIYADGIAQIKRDFEAFSNNSLTQKATRVTYPWVGAIVETHISSGQSGLAFGKVPEPGIYGSTITSPALFRDYLIDQLSLLMKNQDARIVVGHSTTPIPLTFAVEKAAAQMDADKRRQLRQYFDLPDLIATNDVIADGSGSPDGGVRPLSLFSAERVDYSLHRLRHYTASAPSCFQQFILFTNYQRYVDEFAEIGKAAVESGEYTAFVEPGNRIWRKGDPCAEPPLAKPPQMPAYHLMRDDGMGITLVNIGVGPSNAKTITDHLAVLRGHAWLMVGHCGGLRSSQRLGDYVLAHGYLRDDNVLDAVLPTAIPLPTIAEVQLAMAAATSEITGQKGPALKERLRTGTVVTTDDRNWELRYGELATRFNQSRAIAIDMESATIAANGYRFRVPYGTLLCVSDRPLHGEIKLPGMADAFYEQSVSQHLRIGIRAMELLRAEAIEGTLHSRKLRSFDEPAFR